MKIVKHGKRYDDGAPFKGKCDMCGCVVEVTRKEIKHSSDQRDGDYYYVTCPECSHHIYFIDERLGNTGQQNSYNPHDR